MCLAAGFDQKRSQIRWARYAGSASVWVLDYGVTLGDPTEDDVWAALTSSLGRSRRPARVGRERRRRIPHGARPKAVQPAAMVDPRRVAEWRRKAHRPVDGRAGRDDSRERRYLRVVVGPDRRGPRAPTARDHPVGDCRDVRRRSVDRRSGETPVEAYRGAAESYVRRGWARHPRPPLPPAHGEAAPAPVGRGLEPFEVSQGSPSRAAVSWGHDSQGCSRPAGNDRDGVEHRGRRECGGNGPRHRRICYVDAIRSAASSSPKATGRLCFLG